MTLPIAFFERLISDFNREDVIKIADGNYVVRDKPNHLAMMALCAYYHLKYQINILYSPYSDGITSLILEKLEKCENGSKIGVVFNNAPRNSKLLQDLEMSHCIPVIFFKNSAGKIGVFVHDGIILEGENFLSNEISLGNLKGSLIFLTQEITQLSNYGCAIKSIEDCKTLLTYKNIEDFLEERMLSASKLDPDKIHKFDFPAKLYRASELLPKEFSDEIVSKKEISAATYHKKHTYDVKIGSYNKVFNLILSEKSLHASQKVWAMIMVLGFKKVKQEMILSCINPEMAKQYIDAAEEFCTEINGGTLRLVNISGRNADLLANSDENIIKESVQYEPQNLSGEKLKNESLVFQNAYNVFVKIKLYKDGLQGDQSSSPNGIAIPTNTRKIRGGEWEIEM